MAIDQRLARREWWIHMGFTWLAFLALLIVTVILFAVAARFMKVQTMLLMLTSLCALQFIVWIFAKRIVLKLTISEPAKGRVRERLERLMDDFLPHASLRGRPELYLSNMDVPNAFAFGSRLLGNESVAVTPELMHMLSDDELKAVLAHEVGHLAARDTTLMLLVAILLSYSSQLLNHLQKIGRAALFFFVLIKILSYVPQIVAKGISQLREYGADCYSARMLGTGKPLIRALEKLAASHAQRADDNPLTRTRGPLDDIMVSHPRMEMRRRMLQKLES